MTRKNLFLLVAGPLLSASLASGYVPRVVNGVALHRTDFGHVQFSLNSAAVAGLNNASGHPLITSDSDPRRAVQDALNQWNNVPDSGARFTPLTITDAINNENDNRNVIVFRDSPEIQSAVGSALAITDIIYNPADGTILDTDILFSPKLTFSTTLAQDPPTYDLQSITTHELGHALGANHSGILGATMYQATKIGNAAQRSLSADDMAFAANLYPAATASLRYGTLTGTADSGGVPLRGALITAVDRSSGKIVGALSDLTTGQFSMTIPPGTYNVYAEPLKAPVGPSNLYLRTLSAGQNIDTDFLPGPVANPAVYTVTAGATVPVSLALSPGSSSIRLSQSATGPESGGADTFLFFSGPATLPAGRATDLLLIGSGINPTLTEQNFVLLGPATIRPGSLRRDAFTTTVMRLTIDVPDLSTKALASLLINKNGMTAAFSGGLILTPPSPAFRTGSVANAFSGSIDGVAPGEDVSIYGTSLGPVDGQGGIYDATTGFAPGVSGVNVTFDGMPAPLLYVSAGQINAQVPFEVADKSSTNIVVSYNGSSSEVIAARVVPVHPGVYPKAINDDGTLNSATNPIQANHYVTIYALGLGTTTNQPNTGKPAPGLASLAAVNRNVTVNFGSLAVNPVFAGLSPGFVGLYQINVQVPVGLPAGTPVPLVVVIDGVSSQNGVSLFVK